MQAVKLIRPCVLFILFIFLKKKLSFVLQSDGSQDLTVGTVQIGAIIKCN